MDRMLRTIVDGILLSGAVDSDSFRLGGRPLVRSGSNSAVLAAAIRGLHDSDLPNLTFDLAVASQRGHRLNSKQLRPIGIIIDVAERLLAHQPANELPVKIERHLRDQAPSPTAGAPGAPHTALSRVVAGLGEALAGLQELEHAGIRIPTRDLDRVKDGWARDARDIARAIFEPPTREQVHAILDRIERPLIERGYARADARLSPQRLQRPSASRRHRPRPVFDARRDAASRQSAADRASACPHWAATS
jgi:hypothetical protein